MIKLGSLVKDSLTGLSGIAIARCEYLNGCVSVEVQPKGIKDGKPLPATWVDEQLLDIESKAKVGGPQSRPPKLHP